MLSWLLDIESQFLLLIALASGLVLGMTYGDCKESLKTGKSVVKTILSNLLGIVLLLTLTYMVAPREEIKVVYDETVAKLTLADITPVYDEEGNALVASSREEFIQNTFMFDEGTAIVQMTETDDKTDVFLLTSSKETYTFMIETEANEDGSYEYKILNKMELNSRGVNSL